MMLADDGAVAVDDVTNGLRDALRDDVPVVLVGQEADIRALRLVRVGQAHLHCKCPNFGLPA